MHFYHLLAEPEEDLVVLAHKGASSLGGAKGAPEWLRQALTSSCLVCATRTPDDILSLVIGESFLKKVDLPTDLEIERQWAALRIDKTSLEPAAAFSCFSSICEILEDSGVDPRAVSTPEFECFLLPSRQLPHAFTALVAAGHLVSPGRRLLQRPRLVRHRASVRLAGAWKLLEARSVRGTIRLQAACGLFIDCPDESSTEVNFLAGCLVEGPVSFRHRLLTMHPLCGEVPRARLLLDRNTSSLTEEIGVVNESKELWQRVPCSSSHLAVAMVLVSEAPERSTVREGFWIFTAGRFARFIGPARGLLDDSCCKSLSHLTKLKGDSVQLELQSHFEAVCGFVEKPGSLKIEKAFPASKCVGSVFLDAATGEGGKVIVPDKPGPEVIHQLSDGSAQCWRVIEWGFDPFTLGAPPEAQDALPPEPLQPEDQGKHQSSELKKKDKGKQKDGTKTEKHPQKKTQKKVKKDKEGIRIRKRSASGSKARSSDEKQKEKKPKKNSKDSEAKGKAETTRDIGRISINLKAAPAHSFSVEEGNQSLLPPPQPPPQASMAPTPDELHETTASEPETAVPTTVEVNAAAATPQEDLPANFKFPKGYPPPRPEKETPPSTFPANFKFPMGYPPPKPGASLTATASTATASPSVVASTTVTVPANAALPKASASSTPVENSQDVNASAIAAVATAAASGSLPPGTTQVVVVPSQNPGEAPLILSLQGGDLSTLLSLLQSPAVAAPSTSTALPSANSPTSMLPLLQPASSPAPTVMVSLNSGPPPSQYVQLQPMQSVLSVPQQGLQYVVAGSPNHFGGPNFQQVSLPPQRPAMVSYVPAPHGTQPGLPTFGSPPITQVGQFTTSLPVHWGHGVPTAQHMQAFSYLSPPPATRM